MRFDLVTRGCLAGLPSAPSFFLLVFSPVGSARPPDPRRSGLARGAGIVLKLLEMIWILWMNVKR